MYIVPQISDPFESSKQRSSTAPLSDAQEEYIITTKLEVIAEQYSQLLAYELARQRMHHEEALCKLKAFIDDEVHALESQLLKPAPTGTATVIRNTPSSSSSSTAAIKKHTATATTTTIGGAGSGGGLVDASSGTSTHTDNTYIRTWYKATTSQLYTEKTRIQRQIDTSQILYSNTIEPEIRELTAINRLYNYTYMYIVIYCSIIYFITYIIYFFIYIMYYTII